MQTWARRGLQTALVTGGLLMLGTGIASADENVNPDSPASPIDLSVNVPIDVAGNALGTPVGQLDVPNYSTQLSTKGITKPVEDTVDALDKDLKFNDKGREKGLLKGNKVVGNLTVPIQITSNAIGVLGDAEVKDSHHVQEWHHNQDVATDGQKSGLAGNAVVLDWALPVQLAGNAGGLAGGSGSVTDSSASQSVSETGSISTNGRGSGLSGNVVGGQFATPVQVTGNAASWILANAYSEHSADTEAESGGWIMTDGQGGGASGNVVGAPVGLPVKVNGNSAAAWGSDSDTASITSAEAEAGDTTPGINDIPSYIQTNGDASFLSGTIAQPQGALSGNVDSLAASWIGNATSGKALDQAGYSASGSSTTTEIESGGFSSTSGKMSGGSGNIVDAPIAIPVEACGIGGTYIGNAHAACDNTTDAVAGEGTFTTGDGSFLGGNSVHPQPAGTAELFGIGGSHIGNASGMGRELKNVQAGGYNGSTGNDATAAGNIVQVPLAVPVEGFGVGGTFIGQGEGAAQEVKTVKAGGGGNTDDDNGFLTSNLVATPAAVPAQVFGVGGSLIGRGAGKAATDTVAEAGGDVKAKGDKAAAAGNIGFVPVALPVQPHGVGASLIGTGTGLSDNMTDAKAGGNAKATGEEGALAGNIIGAPVGGAASVSGPAAAVAALVEGTAANDVVAKAGGDSETNGDGGAVAGNVIGAQALPIAQVFGDGVSAAAKATGVSSNTTEAMSGGDITTSGVEGAFAGDIVNVPASAVAQVFGDGITVLGKATGVADNVTFGKVGGTATTAGDTSSVSGIDGQLPLGALVQVWEVPLALLGDATAVASNDTQIVREPQINIPVHGLGLGATELPALPRTQERADLPAETGTLPVDLAGLNPLQAAQLPSLPEAPEQRADLDAANLPLDLDALSALRSGDLAQAPALDGVNVAPTAEVPALADSDSSPLELVRPILGNITQR